MKALRAVRRAIGGLVVQLKMCVESVFAESCTTLKHFVDMVPRLGCVLASTLNPWGHIWSTLSTLLGVKNMLWRQRCPRSAPRRPAPKYLHILTIILGVVFSDVRIVLLNLLL